ncbi:MAG TPA: hypothetical protein DDY70_06625 [Clostridiales bacterium]|nr:hypothetical protein [Clostridiales bacterium]
MSLVIDLHADSVSRPYLLNLPFSAPYNLAQSMPHLQVAAAFAGSGEEPLSTRRRRLFAMLDTLDHTAGEEMFFRVRTAEELSHFCRAGSRALLYSVEGGGFLPEELPLLFARGVRIVSLVWDKNEFGASSRESGTDADTGLSAAGVRALRLCESLGILPDLSHVSDRAFFRAAEETRGPLLATHSDFRDLCPHPRNLTAEMATCIARRGGLIGLNLYPPFLTAAPTATADDLLRHVDYGLSLVGEGVLALGFDIDGTSGVYPAGFSFSESIHDRVADLLLSHYSARTADRLLGENAAEFLKKHLPVGKNSKNVG